jgi:hypothetical protein
MKPYFINDKTKHTQQGFKWAKINVKTFNFPKEKMEQLLYPYQRFITITVEILPWFKDFPEELYPNEVKDTLKIAAEGKILNVNIRTMKEYIEKGSRIWGDPIPWPHDKFDYIIVSITKIGGSSSHAVTSLSDYPDWVREAYSK